MVKPHRNHPLWFAYMAHRISGLLLAVFLPAHFYVLGLALNQAAELDGFLRWTEYPIVRLAEIGLVFLLAVHCFGGLRLLALELLPWSPRQKTHAAVATALSFLVSTGFALSVV
jgi:fumarate reductase subunit D